jgi:hypothetical protein
MSETSLEIECRICYIEKKKENFVDCRQCKNSICEDCFENLRTYTCPYCRTQYSIEPPYSLRLERQNAYSIDHPVYGPIGYEPIGDSYQLFGRNYFYNRPAYTGPNVYGPVARPPRRITPELVQEIYNLSANPTSHY